jgi:histidine triad (HIT) family protein
MENCVFCKIINREIPCFKVYENNDVLGFLDVKPHTKGHTVVIPKRHGITLFDFSAKQNELLMDGVRMTMQRVQGVLQPDGFNVGWNHNTAAGQVVPHLHVHIMPRYNGDGGGSMHSIIKNPGSERVEDVAKRFE